MLRQKHGVHDTQGFLGFRVSAGAQLNLSRHSFPLFLYRDDRSSRGQMRTLGSMQASSFEVSDGDPGHPEDTRRDPAPGVAFVSLHQLHRTVAPAAPGSLSLTSWVRKRMKGVSSEAWNRRRFAVLPAFCWEMR